MPPHNVPLWHEDRGWFWAESHWEEAGPRKTFLPLFAWKPSIRLPLWRCPLSPVQSRGDWLSSPEIARRWVCTKRTLLSKPYLPLVFSDRVTFPQFIASKSLNPLFPFSCQLSTNLLLLVKMLYKPLGLTTSLGLYNFFTKIPECTHKKLFLLLICLCQFNL